MRALTIAVFGVVLTGCTFGINQCNSNTDCATPGAVCTDGFCTVSTTGGGSGGGSGGGAGGGSTGGGGGSTVTGGGGGETDAGVACALRTVPCPTGFECRENSSGEANCIVAFESLTLDVEDGGTTFNTRGLSTSLTLVRKLGFSLAQPFASVDVTIDLPDGGSSTSTVQGSSGSYAGQLVLSADGLFAATGSAVFANEDGGVETISSRRVPFSIDTTSPTFAIRPPLPSTYPANTSTYLARDPDLSNAYRRHDIVRIEVESSATDVNPATLRVKARYAGRAGTEFAPAGTCTGAPSCWYFDVDLATIDFPALRGPVELTATGADFIGNSPTTSSPEILSVTRWNWATRLTMAALKASPALSRDGTLVVAANADPSIYVVSSDGGASPVVGTTAALASPAIGRSSNSIEYVFYQSTSSNSALRAFQLSTRTDVGQNCGNALGSFSGTPSASPAVLGDGTDLVRSAAPIPRATLVPGDSGMDLATFLPLGNGGDTCKRAPAESATAPANVVAVGTTVVYPNEEGRITKASVTPSAVSSVSAFPGTPILGQTNGVVLRSSGIVGGGSSGGNGIGSLFQFNTTTGEDAGVVVSGSPTSAPVITADGDYIALFRNGTNTDIRRYSPSGMTTATTFTWPTLFSVTVTPGSPSPVLGQNGLAYFVSNNARILVLEQDDLSSVYEGGFSGVSLGIVTGSPTIDCNRQRPNTATGILYFATEQGYVVSVIVDSKGVDSTAQWPKYQHDVRNTGNIDVAIESCP